MPFVNPDLIAAQFEHANRSGADIVIPKTEHGMEPLHAVYRQETCLPQVEAAIQIGKWRVDSWFEKATIEYFENENIRRYDPEGISFRNTNTPEELERAIQLAKKFAEQENYI
jgi:molybdopterin-guanine dinucleotide biosynthesis protein A